MKKAFSLLTVLSLPAFAQTAASVCATVLMSDDKVACMQAIAGHSVEPGAASVCNTVLMSNDKIACLRGALDKHYSAEELSACRSVLMGGDKASCMAAAGAIPRREPVYEERRRDRYDDDDRDERRERRSERRHRDDDDDDDDTRLLRVTNLYNTTIDRLYYRRIDDRKFKAVAMPATASFNQYIDVRVPDEKLSFCAETPDGYRLYWAKVRRDEALTVGANERNWSQGRCKDLR